MKKTVLVVEDNLDHQFIARAHLEAQNYRVLLADSVLKAIELLWEEKIDLIVLDLWLPEFDGLALLQTLKTHEHLANIPVIVVSGALNTPEEILNLAKYGVGEYLAKPYEPGALVEAVDYHLL